MLRFRQRSLANLKLNFFVVSICWFFCSRIKNWLLKGLNEPLFNFECDHEYYEYFSCYLMVLLTLQFIVLKKTVF